MVSPEQFPDPERLPGLMLFGQFVGEWLMEVYFFNPDGSQMANFKADWMFSWILQGRAIQDVLMHPCREERAAKEKDLIFVMRSSNSEAVTRTQSLSTPLTE